MNLPRKNNTGKKVNLEEEVRDLKKRISKLEQSISNFSTVEARERQELEKHWEYLDEKDASGYYG